MFYQKNILSPLPSSHTFHFSPEPLDHPCYLMTNNKLNKTTDAIRYHIYNNSTVDVYYSIPHNDTDPVYVSPAWVPSPVLWVPNNWTSAATTVYDAERRKNSLTSSFLPPDFRGVTAERRLRRLAVLGRWRLAWDAIDSDSRLLYGSIATAVIVILAIFAASVMVVRRARDEDKNDKTEQDEEIRHHVEQEQPNTIMEVNMYPETVERKTTPAEVAGTAKTVKKAPLVTNKNKTTCPECPEKDMVFQTATPTLTPGYEVQSNPIPPTDDGQPQTLAVFNTMKNPAALEWLSKSVKYWYTVDGKRWVEQEKWRNHVLLWTWARRDNNLPRSLELLVAATTAFLQADGDFCFNEDVTPAFLLLVQWFDGATGPALCRREIPYIIETVNIESAKGRCLALMLIKLERIQIDLKRKLHDSLLHNLSSMDDRRMFFKVTQLDEEVSEEHSLVALFYLRQCVGSVADDIVLLGRLQAEANDDILNKEMKAFTVSGMHSVIFNTEDKQSTWIDDSCIGRFPARIYVLKFVEVVWKRFVTDRLTSLYDLAGTPEGQRDYPQSLQAAIKRCYPTTSLMAVSAAPDEDQKGKTGEDEEPGLRVEQPDISDVNRCAETVVLDTIPAESNAHLLQGSGLQPTQSDVHDPNTGGQAVVNEKLQKITSVKKASLVPKKNTTTCSECPENDTVFQTATPALTPVYEVLSNPIPHIHDGQPQTDAVFKTMEDSAALEWLNQSVKNWVTVDGKSWVEERKYQNHGLLGIWACHESNFRRSLSLLTNAAMEFKQPRGEYRWEAKVTPSFTTLVKWFDGATGPALYISRRKRPYIIETVNIESAKGRCLALILIKLEREQIELMEKLRRTVISNLSIEDRQVFLKVTQLDKEVSAEHSLVALNYLRQCVELAGDIVLLGRLQIEANDDILNKEMKAFTVSGMHSVIFNTEDKQSTWIDDSCVDGSDAVFFLLDFLHDMLKRFVTDRLPRLYDLAGTPKENTEHLESLKDALRITKLCNQTTSLMAYLDR
eukprot:GHVQ01014760.1.p1 GENE.GHVQ01014760.1~~GHVQ01014760.1.p1  ORF type:complete len:1056 (+),score=122.46 GHVQ01014760.1:139-3168(+)